jgi:ethanolamine ammonia-lyase small subunit
MSGSITRQLMATLATRLGQVAAPPPPLPRVEAPPVRVHAADHPLHLDGATTAHTTALLGVGHVGTRYATDLVLQFQAELAVAHAAVNTELPAEWAHAHGFLPLQSRCASHREFLLRPDLGRRLDDASLERLRAKAVRDVDVQLILADGLSAVACQGGGVALFEAVRAACLARGLTVGTPVCAKFARVWLEDEIGHEVRAKVALILLGERPGLGTGDGLSAYAVYQPKVGNTDGERNMMSNLHARGTTAVEAAPRLAALLSAMLAQKTSGVTLDLAAIDPTGTAGGRGYRAPQIRQHLVQLGEPTKGPRR